MPEPSDTLVSLIVSLVAPEQRTAAMRDVAAYLGVDHLLVFTRDDEIDELLAAPGFPQTLPSATNWRAFLQECVKSSEWRTAELPSPYTREMTSVLGFATSDVAVALLGATPHQGRLDELAAFLPLIAATMRNERIASNAIGQARAARIAANQSRTLASALDLARQQLGGALLQARAARERFSFLAEVSLRLTESLDLDTMLNRLVDLVVPRVGDCCVIELVDERFRLHKRFGADVLKPDFAFEPLDESIIPIEQPEGHPSASVIRTGEPVILRDVADDYWSRFLEGAYLPDACRDRRVTSLMIMPLVFHERCFGAMTFAQHSSSRRYSNEDATLAADLASRTAAAIDNARLYEALREGDRRKDEFLAMLAHELRNPLSPISNIVDLLQRQSGDPNRVRALSEVLGRQVRQMTRLIDDLLDVARISSGKLKLRFERADLSRAVASAVEAMQPAIDDADHELIVHIDDEPLLANIDPARIAQIVSNLLSNATKYTPRGGRITVECSRDGADGVIRVSDTGIGIPTTERERIFDMFSQIDETPGVTQTGLGIGLTLVRTLVGMHGGAVTVESEGAGRGSAFTVRIGLSAAEVESGANGAREMAPIAASESDRRSRRRRRVMVVEDHKIVAQLFAELLEDLGHEVEVARSGEEALQRIGSYEPEIIFSDISMDGMSGYDLAQALRAKPELSELILVAVTGFGQQGDKKRALDAGFDAHLVKPVEADALVAFFDQIA
ncbi:MAG: ATP-binding protein [Phycisphaerales bacterium]